MALLPDTRVLLGRIANPPLRRCCVETRRNVDGVRSVVGGSSSKWQDGGSSVGARRYTSCGQCILCAKVPILTRDSAISRNRTSNSGPAPHQPAVKSRQIATLVGPSSPITNALSIHPWSRRWNHSVARIPPSTDAKTVTQNRPPSQPLIQTTTGTRNTDVSTTKPEPLTPTVGLTSRFSRMFALAPGKDGETSTNSSIKKLVDLARPEKKQLTTAIGLVSPLTTSPASPLT